MSFLMWYQSVTKLGVFLDEKKAELYFNKVTLGYHNSLGNDLYEGLFEEGSLDEEGIQLLKNRFYTRSEVDEEPSVFDFSEKMDWTDEEIVFSIFKMFASLSNKTDKFLFIVHLSEGMSTSGNRKERRIIAKVAELLLTSKNISKEMSRPLRPIAALLGDIPTTDIVVKKELSSKSFRNLDAVRYNALKDQVTVELPALLPVFV